MSTRWRYPPEQGFSFFTVYALNFRIIYLILHVNRVVTRQIQSVLIENKFNATMYAFFACQVVI